MQIKDITVGSVFEGTIFGVESLWLLTDYCLVDLKRLAHSHISPPINYVHASLGYIDVKGYMPKDIAITVKK